MKLKLQIEFVEMSDEIIGVPVGEGANKVSGILKLNKAGKEIVELLQQETTVQRIVDTLSSKYDNENASLEEYVQEVIDKLQSADLLN